MSFILENKVWLRVFVFALFIVVMLGPWLFDLINVPALYPCDKPFVRLYGDFCGYPMSGFEAIKWFTSGFSVTLAELIKGNFAAQTPELIALICVLITVLPFFTNTLLIRNRTSRRLQTINVIAWAVACLPSLALFILQTNKDEFIQYFHLLWGLWLYILLAIGTILFEILVLRLDTKPVQAT